MFRIAWDKTYAHSLPEGHRFPMEKYDLIPEQLMFEGSISASQIFKPLAAKDEEVLRVHSKAYVNDLKNLSLSAKAIRRIGFPLNADLVKREYLITGGTIQACEYAEKDGIAFNVAGGTHHAYKDKGEGFCLFNDIAISATNLLIGNRAKRILIVDLDVHQGNGSAVIFQNNQNVFTFSMHGQDNYPLKKEQSDLDIALPKGTRGDVYLQLLEDHLKKVQKLFQPDFAFYLSGVDVLETDKLGKLSLRLQDCRRRDQVVLEFFQRLNIPLVCAMGGGYSPQVSTIVEAHCNTYRLANSIFA